MKNTTEQLPQTGPNKYNKTTPQTGFPTIPCTSTMQLQKHHAGTMQAPCTAQLAGHTPEKSWPAKLRETWIDILAAIHSFIHSFKNKSICYLHSHLRILEKVYFRSGLVVYKKRQIRINLQYFEQSKYLK